MNPLLQGFKAGLRKADRRPVWQWCEDNVTVDDTSSMPGRWKLHNSPWVGPVMECAQQKEVQFVVVKCSAQSAKTQTIMNTMCWIVSENPSPSMWVMAAKDEAKEFMRDRVVPTLRKCKSAFRLFRGVQGMTCLFDGMPFYFVGAGSKSKLQSKPIRWLFLDEVRNYKHGMLELALKRVTSYERVGYKVFIISTPGNAGDDVDEHFKSGSQHTWNIKCPKCQKLQPLLFSQMRWDVNEHTKPDGQWNFDRLAPTIRLHCIGCEHVWRDGAAERRQLIRDGQFVQMNPNAPESIRSFTWNALLPFWVTWRKTVQEYLRAVDAARCDPPDIEPLKNFYNEALGMAWEESLGVVEDYDFLSKRHGDYNLGDPWPDEHARFMAADRQEKGGEHYFWVIRAFSRDGRSRLVGYGRSETTEQLDEIREAYNVPVKNAMMDSGHKATSVYRWCMRAKWKPFKGDKVEFFPVTVVDPATRKKKVLRRIWTKSEVDPVFGTKDAGSSRMRISLFRFAGDTVKDFLAEHMRGLVGDWTIPHKVGPEYMQQMTAEARIASTDALGKTVFKWVKRREDNHFWDCEQMILVAAVISKIVQNGIIRASKVTASPVVNG